MATSATQLRTALIAKADILVQLACIWEWLHFYFHSDLLKCVCTDEQGRFETTIWYPCGGDKPDIYFKAVQCIDCALHIIYNPGVACHTYWNYKCDSEVVLVVTDPAAVTCVPQPSVELPEDITTWVMPYAVGGTPLNQIKSSGLTDYGGTVDAPFGSLEDKRLGLRHGYSSAIPTAGLYYYRWRYKKDSETDWHDFSETVVRHYVKELPGELPTYPVCTLGPKALDGKHLYRFKPHDPSDCGDFIPGGHNYWPTDDWFADIYSGFLDTYGLPEGVNDSAGKYNIKLEVYDNNGNRVAPGPGTFRFIVPTGVAADGVTIETREANPVEIEDDGFVFDLHIDNRECDAIIDAPTIDGVGADLECGFLRYMPGDQVHIAFHAQHPANFATFHFWIKRSANPISDVSGEVAALAAGVYSGDGNGNFDKSLNPSEFPDFPFGAVVPAKTKIEIIGMLIGTHRKGVYFGDKCRYLKLSNGREVLFDSDRTGLYVAHGMNNYPFHAENYERAATLFPTPLVFGPGDELIVNLSVGGVALAADAGLICLIEKVTALEG